MLNKFTKPLKNLEVSCPFGFVFSETGNKHLGVDFKCEVGTEVFSISDGEVVKVGFDKEGMGKFIEIKTDKFKILYGHLDNIHVEEGDKVSREEVIGLSGNTGESTTGPHLHLEIKKNGEHLDPMKIIKD